ncbi:MAG: pilus assembly protein PilW, partial [Burkholderiales bacterium PBB4]
MTRTIYPQRQHKHQLGLSLVELMVTLAITMFIVAAAGYVYLGTRESQRAIDNASNSAEAGSFALQQLGREIMNAGFYPSTMPPITSYFNTMRRADGYPPAVGVPVRATDWIAPNAVYLAPIFGCEGAKFNHVDGTCGTTVAGAPDSIV